MNFNTDNMMMVYKPGTFVYFMDRHLTLYRGEIIHVEVLKNGSIVYNIEYVDKIGNTTCITEYHKNVNIDPYWATRSVVEKIEKQVKEEEARIEKELKLKE